MPHDTSLLRARQGLPVRFEDLPPAEQRTLVQIKRAQFYRTLTILFLFIGVLAGLYAIRALL